jgi:trimethylamine:corrinoid methyltransferase-like protein
MSAEAGVDEPRIRPIRWRFRVELLSEDDVARIHEAILSVLEGVGLEIASEPLLRELAAAGARADLDTGRVRLPRELVEEAVALTPRSYVMAARDPACDMLIDGSAGYLSLDGTTAHVIDLESGARRLPTTEDYVQAMVLADAIPEISFTWPPFAIPEVPPRLQSVEQAYLELARCTKHAQPNESITPEDARATIEMAVAVSGSEEELRRRPLISSYQMAISPLTYDGATIEAAREFARAGVPAGFVSMAVATAAAPTTLAGQLVSMGAEVLGGVAVLQTLVPGAPTFVGAYEAFMDLSSGDIDAAWGGEDVLIKLAVAQMARRWGLANNMGGFGTGANAPDWQAGVQSTLSTMGVALAGSGELISAAGSVHASMAFSFEELVLEAELFGMVCHMLDRGFPVTEEDLAVPVIESVGPGGHFLAHPHTRAHMRERWRSELFVREPWDEWVREGRPEPRDRAKEKVREILATHEPEPLPDDVERELVAIVERRRRELEAVGG